MQTSVPETNLIASQRCTVVVPCYNEAERLQPEKFSAFLAETDRVDFLFVNDGSRDATLAVLHALQAQHPERVFVLDKQPNGGKAEAVRAGLLQAIALGRSAYTGFWDADLATPLAVIPHMLSKLEEDPGRAMVFGSRVRLLGHAIHRKAMRHYLGRCFATVVSIVLRLPVYDTQCGAKLFRITPELEQVLAAPFLSRWIFDVEIIARFLAMHEQDTQYAFNTIYECPLPSWEDVAGSKVGPLDFFHAFYELLIIHNTYRREKRAWNKGHGRRTAESPDAASRL
jgi:glycosyltransferase involved in cell wall biosynthesis